MSGYRNLAAIIEELAQDARHVDEDAVKSVVSLILAAKRVFVAGAGRSGFAARAFSNRLMHLGLDSHFADEPTCPSIREGDLIIVGSGSGNTAGIALKAEMAKKEGAKIATITMNSEGKVGQTADAVIVVPGRSSMRMSGRSAEKAPSIQPEGSSFEQLSWLIYDSMVVDLKRALGQTQAQMNFRHSNLE